MNSNMNNSITINIDEISNENKDLFENNDLFECMICIEYIPSNDIVQLPIENLSGCECKGQYHKKCLEMWFINKNEYTCPICLIKFNAYLEYNQKYNIAPFNIDTYNINVYNQYLCIRSIICLLLTTFAISLWHFFK